MEADIEQDLDSPLLDRYCAEVLDKVLREESWRQRVPQEYGVKAEGYILGMSSVLKASHWLQVNLVLPGIKYRVHSSVRRMSRPFEKSKALLREIKHGRKTLNHNNNDCVRGKEGNDSEKEQGRRLETTPWIPHPRTGIYYPKGHERVMDGIPNGAATFKQAYWLRSSEGTDKPIADPSANGIFEHPFLNM